MPKGRTTQYIIWRACERFSILPPDVQSQWDDCDVNAQAHLLAFNEIRMVEEAQQEEEKQKFHAKLAGARVF